MSGERVKELLLPLERDTVPSNAWKILEELGSFDRYGRPLPSCADIFEVDEVARALYPRDADPGLLPLRVYGDGTVSFGLLRCSFTVMKTDILISDPLTNSSRTMYEQSSLRSSYRQRASSSCATSLSATALLSSTLQRNTSLVFSKALESCSLLQDAYFEAMQEEIKNTCSSGWYSSLLHILGLSTAVGTTINLIYPMYNEGIRPFVHTIINLMYVESGGDASINIMWSTTSKKNTISAWFEPNHFVPYFLAQQNLLKHFLLSSSRFKISSRLQLLVDVLQTQQDIL